MSISSWLWGSSQLDDAVEKATSELRPSGTEDIALNLEICDQIRSKSVPAKDSMRAMKRRLDHKNPNVQLLTLSLTDTCVKNGGDHFLVEVASREFMDNLVSILKIPTLNYEVKNAILRLIQNWTISFEGKPSLSYVGQVYKTLTQEGFNFPPKDLTAANSAMVDTQTAPEWIDSDVCMRCRTAFSFTNRKHHCRNCGQVFDQQCSSKSIPLPHFGIDQPVRVCDGCYHKLIKNTDKIHRHSTSLHGARNRSARDLADAELQRAIQLSLSEVNGSARPGYVPAQPPSWKFSEPPIVDRYTRPASSQKVAADDDDPDLKAAIEASLREAAAPRPSAPLAMETPLSEEPEYSGPGYSQSYPPGVVPPHPAIKLPNYDLEPLETDAILTFSQSVEQVHAAGGHDISRYPAVGELYDKANSLRPKLAMSMDDSGRKEQMLTDMHDKMSQIVKLYDNILSEQLARPSWRSPPTAASSQQPYGYTQWTQASPPPQTAAPPIQPVQPLEPYVPPQEQQQIYQPDPNQMVQQLHVPVPISQQSYTQPQQYASPPQQQYAPPPPPVQLQQRYILQSPPPQQQYVPHRQNTISYSASTASAPTPTTHLVRNHTLAHVPPSSPLPQFPVAPTSAPQAFDLHGPSMIPSGVVQQEERKEALLIDL